MQITEVLHIMHCSKSLYTNITPFSQLYKRILPIQQMTQNRPGFLLRKPGRFDCVTCAFQALMQNLAGILDRSLSGCQNYRAFGVTVIRYL